MLRNVAVFISEGQQAFEMAVLCEVFGLDRTSDGVPNFDFAVCSLKPGIVTTSAGFEILTKHGIERLAAAELIAIPAAMGDIRGRPPDALIQALNDAVRRGSRVMSVCSGAFTLAAAGLLDGRPATTHWMYTDILATRYPSIKVNRDVLYVDDGEVLTSAGTAAGIDLCLHIVRKEFGAAVANKIARRMVVAPHRDGGQAQFIEKPMGDPVPGQDLQPVFNWALEHLDAAVTVAELARRAHMSARTFARRFAAVTGTTPHKWLVAQRAALAERMLEETDHGVELVAQRSGFGSAAALRHHFSQRRGTSPRSYRQTFRDSS